MLAAINAPEGMEELGPFVEGDCRLHLHQGVFEPSLRGEPPPEAMARGRRARRHPQHVTKHLLRFRKQAERPQRIGVQGAMLGNGRAEAVQEFRFFLGADELGDVQERAQQAGRRPDELIGARPDFRPFVHRDGLPVALIRVQQVSELEPGLDAGGVRRGCGADDHRRGRGERQQKQCPETDAHETLPPTGHERGPPG